MSSPSCVTLMKSATTEPHATCTSPAAAFERCSAALYRFFMVRTRDEHLTDDFMQQLWIQAAGAQREIPRDEQAYWLIGVARNLVRAHWRRQAARGMPLSLADPQLAAQLGHELSHHLLPPERLEQQEVRTQLLLAITGLDPDDQTLLTGHYFEGRSHQDLAKLTGVSVRAIEGRLYRARQALRDRLHNLDE